MHHQQYEVGSLQVGQKVQCRAMSMSAVNSANRITSGHNYKIHGNVKLKVVHSITLSKVPQLLLHHNPALLCVTHISWRILITQSEHKSWQLLLQPLMDGRSDCSGRRRLTGYPGERGNEWLQTRGRGMTDILEGSNCVEACKTIIRHTMLLFAPSFYLTP